MAPRSKPGDKQKAFQLPNIDTSFIGKTVDEVRARYKQFMHERDSLQARAGDGAQIWIPGTAAYKKHQAWLDSLKNEPPGTLNYTIGSRYPSRRMRAIDERNAAKKRGKQNGSEKSN